jgi:type I restriction enzyme S subunit
MLYDKKNRGEALPYLANINVRWGEFDLENLREMRFEHDEMDRYGLKYGDIVMCEGGEPGRCAIWKESVPGMMIQKALHRIRPRDCLDHRFLFYSFLHKGKIGTFAPLCTGATIRHLPRQRLAKVEIEFPQLEVQRGIADILSAYDDLIENNRRRMALLEQSARHLYEEWFVRLRFPGHERSRVADGVPQGWERGSVSDFYETASGGTPSRTNPDFFTGEIPWVKTQELLNTFITDTDEKITEDALKKSAAKLFPERTVLVAMYGATIGQIGILATPATSNQACCAIIPRGIRGSYIYAFLFFLENKPKLVSLSMGAAQNNVNQQTIRSYPMVMPPRLLAERFYATLGPVFDQWLNLQHQTEKLRAARDLLLPRLMSGEIAV